MLERVASLARSRKTRFACPNRGACSQAFIVMALLQISSYKFFLQKGRGFLIFNRFLGDISRLRVAFTANVNVRFKLRSSQNRK